MRDSRFNIRESKQDQNKAPVQDKNLHYPCNITAKEPLSAIPRAKTNECKQNIVNLVCSLEEGLVYPKSLPNYCKPKIDPDQVRGEGMMSDTIIQ